MLSADTIAFLEALQANNSRAWFETHKADYKRHWKDAGENFARSFCDILQSNVDQTLVPKVFRLHRDLRFSKDKTPYHTHLHVSAMTAAGSSDAPSFMLGVQPGRLSIGMGVFAFTKTNLERWRDCAGAPGSSPLMTELTGLREQGFRFNLPELKKTPKGYPTGHQHDEWLRRKGLHVWWDSADVTVCLGEDGARASATVAAQFIPLYTELVALGAD
ncbi:MAG: DUF2461 domain-containing protein [Pseudomonadota bacterium]